jgi:stage IV sporulation protein FB
LATALPNRFSWSIRLAKWRGLEVRVHLSLILLALLAGAVSLEAGTLFGVTLIAGLLLSIIAHEAAHAIVALKLGGDVTRIVLGPHGGLESPQVPDEPEPQVCVAMAGPVTHLALTVISTAVLAMMGDTRLLQLFNPANLQAAMSTDMGVMFFRSLLWMNWVLFLLNWIPAYPFDGAPTLRALLWPTVGRRTAAVITSRVALAVAIGLMIGGIAIRWLPDATPLPVWSSLLMLGLFTAVSSQRDLLLSRWIAHERDELTLSDGISDPIDASWLVDDSDNMVLVEQHHDQLRERYERQRKAQEAYEDARVDDILARIHNGGIDHLTPEDQAFLKRASERYRSRRHDSVDESDG